MGENISDIPGRWRIIEIDGSDPTDGETKVPSFIWFELGGSGDFAFGYLQGTIDHRLLMRDGKPGVEWTWHGNDEMNEVLGRGWAVLQPDRSLRGKLFIHQGGETDFVAKKICAKSARRSAIQKRRGQRPFKANTLPLSTTTRS